ncbi:hypothetical protein I4U23_031235 [Adineta vaga]|nr:hypothetical protein I4U23_031235 [Adineta vaga]
MAFRNNNLQRAATTLDVAALRRQLDEIERTQKENISGNLRLEQIQQQADQLQKESYDRLAFTGQKQIEAEQHLNFVMKRTKEINEVMKALEKAESVDLCFLMDCTNSMRKYIDDVKNHIFKTIDVLKTRFSHLNIRLAFVGYRDLNLPQDKQFSILDFTDKDTFHSFVSMIECENGGDYCEDVLGGLQRTINLNWKQPVRILIHVADAPSHGRRYHDLSERKDYYLTHDTDGSIGYSLIQELVELQIAYFFGRLKSHTDKMIEQFLKYAEERMTIEQIDVDKFTNLLPFIVETVSRSISNTTSSLLKNLSPNSVKIKTLRTVDFEEKEPIWSMIQTRRVRVVKYECNDQLKCVEVNQQWNIKIAAKPFAEGGMRLAYYGLMEYKDRHEKVVLKEYKQIDKRANIKDKYLEILDCQTIADYLAQQFNNLPSIKNLIIVKKIKFIMLKLVFDRSDDGKHRNLTMERYIEGSYKKFSNNAGYINLDDPAFTLQAFSHWTNERTDGNMIVVDLQGIDIGDNQTYLLTDPCIHSTDLMRFGRTNLGKPGIKRFFQTHMCNAICHALKLRRHKDQPEITSSKYDIYFIQKSNKTLSN